MAVHVQRLMLLALCGGLLALPAGPAWGRAASPDVRGSLQRATITRTFYIHTPPTYDGRARLPLLIALHPSASSGRAMAALTGFDAQADAHNFIAVYPDSLELVWGDGRTEADPDHPSAPVDDVGFITGLIDHLAATYAVDASQVYLTGFGNGGLMAYRLACEAPGRFRAVAVVAALMWSYHRRACPVQPAAPLSLFVMSGTADPLYEPDTHFTVPLFSSDEWQVLGIEDTMNFWAARNDCYRDTALTASAIVYTHCPPGIRLAYYRVTGAGSHWPRTGYMLNQFGIDATEIVTRFLLDDPAWNVDQPAIDVGQTRSTILYVPVSIDPAVPAPLIVALHGRQGSGLTMAYLTNLDRVADANGFMVLYPSGINNEWNYLRSVPPFDYDPNIDDAAFLRALLDDLGRDLNIDRGRVYVTGISNGGFMTQRLACEAPGIFAAFAAVGATAFTGIDQVCDGAPPVPLLLIHGTDDPVVPEEGLVRSINGQDMRVTFSMANTLAFWAAHNGCPPDAYTVDPLPVLGQSAGTSAAVWTYTGCLPGAALTYYEVAGGGHNWPGETADYLERYIGLVNKDFHASEVIWQFFARHTLNGG